jgi:hypothetical protein
VLEVQVSRARREADEVVLGKTVGNVASSKGTVSSSSGKSEVEVLRTPCAFD